MLLTVNGVATRKPGVPLRRCECGNCCGKTVVLVFNQ
jgi:hypothetical protein